VLPGAVYHVWSRGVRKLAVFEDDLDRMCFCMLLAEAVARYNVVFYSVCQMGNHYHFVLETPRGNLSEALQFINGEYSRLANQRHGRRGHSFEERFGSQVVEREHYLRRVNRYVVLNPVKARLVTRAEDWKWSTYRATAGLEPAPAWLQTDWITWAFKAATIEEAQERYRTYVNEPRALKARWSARDIALGPASFRKTMAAALEELKEDRRIPTVAQLPERVELATLFDPVTGIPRESTVLDAHAKHGYCVTEIASFLGVHRMTVTRIIRRMMLKTGTRKPLGLLTS
jgi:putative transposase